MRLDQPAIASESCFTWACESAVLANFCTVSMRWAICVMLFSTSAPRAMRSSAVLAVSNCFCARLARNSKPRACSVAKPAVYSCSKIARVEPLSRPIWNRENTPITKAPANTLANAKRRLARTVMPSLGPKFFKAGCAPSAAICAPMRDHMLGLGAAAAARAAPMAPMAPRAASTPGGDKGAGSVGAAASGSSSGDSGSKADEACAGTCSASGGALATDSVSGGALASESSTVSAWGSVCPNSIRILHVGIQRHGRIPVFQALVAIFSPSRTGPAGAQAASNATVFLGNNSTTVDPSKKRPISSPWAKVTVPSS